MPLTSSHATPGLDDAEAIRHADAELLSLALIDARNVTLRWLALLEEARLLEAPVPGRLPIARIGHAAWYQEWMVARHVQRHRGAAADRAAPRLPASRPEVDGWFATAGAELAGLDAALLREWMAETLETTLDLLAASGGSDDALFAFRAALTHEDRVTHGLCELALAEAWPLALPAAPSRADREAVWMPGQRWQLGSPPGGFVPENEHWAHEVVLPAFEIDAQVVTWARYVPFAESGGYDRRELWSEAGWAWLAATGRRAPRHVEQLRDGVVALRQARLVRVPAQQPVLHVSRYEAEAWCRWAERRLPTEPEWEVAASTAAARGFAWGDVHEWVAGRARPWPGHAPTADGLDALPPGAGTDPAWGVLRGATWLSRGRLRHARARRFMRCDDDSAIAGFRSCAP